MAMTKDKTTWFLLILAVAATLNGLGHQLQIQELKAEITSLKIRVNADHAAQWQSEENLTKTILTLYEFRAQDAERARKYTDDMRMRLLAELCRE